MEAVENLKNRCFKSGYSTSMVQEILAQAGTLDRTLTLRSRSPPDNQKTSIRLVVLTGTPYERKFIDFAKRMNQTLASENLKSKWSVVLHLLLDNCYLIITIPLHFRNVVTKIVLSV